jgi:hypothetical protein
LRAKSTRPNSARGALDHALDHGGIRDVSGLEHGAAAVLLHHVGDDHTRAPCREQPRGGPPDARGPAGDDGDVARCFAARAGSVSCDVGHDRASLVAA